MSLARELASSISATAVTGTNAMEWRGPAGSGAASAGVLNLTTAEETVIDADQLGRIDFSAPKETGADALLVGASIYAEADAAFSATVNSTDLVFATGDSAAASEKLRIDSTGQVTFADGAIDVNIASNDTSNGLKLGGTLVSATAAELNIMDGCTSTAAELNLLDGVSGLVQADLTKLAAIDTSAADLNNAATTGKAIAMAIVFGG